MRILIVLFIFFLSTTVKAQTSLTTFDASSINILYGQTLGDSAIVFGKSSRGVFQALVISPNGGRTSIPLMELEKKALCATLNTPTSIDFYFFNKKDDQNLKILRYDKSLKTKSIEDSGIVLSGKLLGSSVSKSSLYLFSLLPDETVKITQLKSEKIYESSFKLNLPFNEYTKQGTPQLSKKVE